MKSRNFGTWSFFKQKFLTQKKIISKNLFLFFRVTGFMDVTIKGELASFEDAPVLVNVWFHENFFCYFFNFVWLFHEFFRLQHPIQHFSMDLQYFGAGFHILSVEMKIVNYLWLVRNVNKQLIICHGIFFSVKSNWYFFRELVPLIGKKCKQTADYF